MLKKLYDKMEIGFLLIVFVLSGVILFKRIFEKPKFKDDNVTLNIKDLTMSVKDQLEQIDSLRKKKNEYPLFKIESFDLELNFIIKRTITNDSRLENQLITISSGQDYSKEQVQKIVLHMKTNSDKVIETPALDEK